MKVECQDQDHAYQKELSNVKGCGFFFRIPTPLDSVFCSMKPAALLSRAKGRDFHDVMFLMSQTQPDFGYPAHRCGITNMADLKQVLAELLERTDLSQKVRDVEHLLFSRQSSQGILLFPEFVATLS